MGTLILGIAAGTHVEIIDTRRPGHGAKLTVGHAQASHAEISAECGFDLVIVAPNGALAGPTMEVTTLDRIAIRTRAGELVADIEIRRARGGLARLAITAAKWVRINRSTRHQPPAPRPIETREQRQARRRRWRDSA